jgi:DNA-binding transcriptional ArsR family regulator
MEHEPYSEQADLFRALMNPSRIAILLALRGGEQCVCHLEAHLGYPQAYLSKQLAVLRAATLVADRREGWNVYYRVTCPAVFTLLDVARAIAGEPAPGPRAASASCPCPRCAASASAALAGIAASPDGPL